MGNASDDAAPPAGGSTADPSGDPSALRSERRARFAADVLELDVVLAAIARRADSSLGRRAILEIAPLPKDEARERHGRAVELEGLARHSDLPHFAGVSDVVPATPDAWSRLDEDRFASLRAFLEANVRLKEWTLVRAEVAPRLAEWMEGSPDTTELVQRIDRVIDARGRVRDDASARLAKLRETVQTCSEQVERAVRGVLQRSDVRAHLSDHSIHRRGGRPVLAVKAKQAGRVKGLVHDRSSTGESVFVEPVECVELGNRLAAAAADERREVERVLLELTRALYDDRAVVALAAERAAELELCTAAVRWAADMDGRVPLEPGMEGASAGLLLRGARHPQLVDQVASGQIEAVTPLDLRLGVDFHLLIITGPNTGGKTLALKTAGLLAALAASGLPVPAARGTTVPKYDAVLADIGDEQEIRQNLSTFASHLVRVQRVLREATPSTLVLLDELGGGTDPDEGAALGEAILETLLARGVPVLATTHIGKLKEFAFRRARAENACAEFDSETLEPRYRLLVGTPGESSALVIARRLGLDGEVVDLAALRLSRRDESMQEAMEELRRARISAETTRLVAEQDRDDALEAREALALERAALERKSELLEAEAQKGIEERVRDAMRQLARAKQRLDHVPPEARRELAACLDALEADLSGASLSERRQAFLQSLRKGSLVYLPRYRQRVIVQKVHREKRELVARLGAMHVRVAFDEVTPYEAL